MKSIRGLIDHEPDVIAPGHGRPYAVTREMMEATEHLFRKQQQMFADILPVGETDFGMDPSWVSIYPYQTVLGPGERQRLEIRVRNYRPEPMKFEAALVAPSGLRVQPEVVKFEVPGRSDAARPSRCPPPRVGPLRCHASRSPAM